MISIKKYIKNHFSFFKYNIKKELRDTQQELRDTQKELKDLQVYSRIINYYNNEPSNKYNDEISYLKKMGLIKIFPYKQIRTIENVITGFDENKNLPFVLHKKDKRLYFPRSWGIEGAKDSYISLVQFENILGGEYSEKSPHQYQTQNFCVREGDIVLDVGSAEALFSLDIIDIAKKVYIFESDENWVEPLKTTFEPYRDKVVIINKLVSDVDSIDQVKLESCIELEDVKGLFIKMDIEGYEKQVLEGNMDLLNKNIDIRVACCTYHKQNDAEDLNKLFNDIGYKTEFSEGYMIFIYDNDLRPPYFRHGLIRAHKVLY